MGGKSSPEELGRQAVIGRQDHAERTALLTAGICSVTLRQLPTASVVATASQAGLDGIEWGTDTHLTHDAEARTASLLCRSRGLRVLSLGSYYRLGSFTGFDVVLSRARAAGAPRIRVWAGGKGSSEASRDDWSAVIRDAQRVSDLAEVAGIQIALEYHGGTLTDSTISTLRLLDRIDRQNVGTYWQPPAGMDDRTALASFQELGPFVAGVHCFSWRPATERRPLADRLGLWQSVANAASDLGRPLDFMLEFVADDSHQNVLSDAATLNKILSAASSGGPFG